MRSRSGSNYWVSREKMWLLLLESVGWTDFFCFNSFLFTPRYGLHNRFGQWDESHHQRYNLHVYFPHTSYFPCIEILMLLLACKVNKTIGLLRKDNWFLNSSINTNTMNKECVCFILRSYYESHVIFPYLTNLTSMTRNLLRKPRDPTHSCLKLCYPY